MIEIMNGVELHNVKGIKVGVCFFNEGDLYFSISGNQPVVIENIHEDTIQQLGDFFYYLKDESRKNCANRIDFPSISIRVMETTIYFTQGRSTVMFESIGPTELKRFGTWLRKQAK